MFGLTYLMQPPMGCGHLRSTSHFLSPISSISERKRSCVASVNARLDGVSSDKNLDAAIRAASIRFEESLRPVIISTYAELFEWQILFL